MALNCIVISKSEKIPQVITNFLSQARFIKNLGQFASIADADSLLRSDQVHYLLIDTVNNPEAINQLSGSDPEELKTLLFSANNIFKVEPMPKDLSLIMHNGNELGEKMVMEDGGIRFRFGPRDMTLEMSGGETRLLLSPAPEKNKLADSLFVKSENKITRLGLKDIVYLESQKDYIHFHTQNETFRVLSRMKNVALELGENEFMRIHRSYLIRLDQIKTIENEHVYLNGVDKPLPIGPSFKHKLLNAIHFV